MFSFFTKLLFDSPPAARIVAANDCDNAVRYDRNCGNQRDERCREQIKSDIASGKPYSLCECGLTKNFVRDLRSTGMLVQTVEEYADLETRSGVQQYTRVMWKPTSWRDIESAIRAEAQDNAKQD